MAATTPDLLAGPIVATLVRLASPNVLGLLAQTLSISYDGFIVARLGTDALAAVALVFPLSMLMVQFSRGAMGGGVASAVARALGGGSASRAGAVAWHGMVIEFSLGVVVGAALLTGGPLLYAGLGGHGRALELAQAYALPLFAGATATWLHNGLASVHAGSGNMRLPAVCMVVSALSHVALCPLLVFGFGPVPALGIAGASLSFVALNAVFAGVLAWPLLTGRAAIRLRWLPLRSADVREVLRVGLPASISPFINNANVIALTGYAGAFGTSALAGYGVGARLEYLLSPLAFGVGTALLAMVGRNVGAGRHPRAARVAWTGSLLVAGMTGAIGVVVAVWPDLWTMWFIADAASPVRAASNLYLHIVGAFYAPLGFAMAFYFASQGAGRLRWPLLGSAGRLGVAIAGGGLAVSLQSLPALYAATGLSFLIFALVPGIAFRAGAWAPDAKPGSELDDRRRERHG